MSFKILLVTALCAIPTFAQDRQFNEVAPSAFSSLTSGQIGTNSIYYTSNKDGIVSFADWSTQAPVESKLLGLFPGFVEPTIQVIQNGVRKTPIEKLMIFSSRAKFILNRTISPAALTGLLKMETINKLAPEIKNIAISPSQLMSVVAGHGDVKNFQWEGCKPQASELGLPAQRIQRPQRALELSYINPKDRQWCADPDTSVCIESCFLFDSRTWKDGILAYNTLGVLREDFDPVDYGIGMQSEIRLVTSERELNPSVSVRSLTNVSTPMIAAVEQNIFYINQILQYGKILAIFQADPSNPQRTVVTSFLVIGIRTRAWLKDPGLADVLLGRSSRINTETGLTAGLPKFSKDLLTALSTVLDDLPAGRAASATP